MKGEFWGRNPCEAPLAKIPCQDCRGQDKTCFWLSAVEAVGSAPKSGSSVGCCDLSPWRLGSSAPLFPAADGLAKPGGGRASPQLLWHSERRSPLRGDLEDASWPILVDSIQDFRGAQVVQKSAVKVKRCTCCKWHVQISFASSKHSCLHVRELMVFSLQLREAESPGVNHATLSSSYLPHANLQLPVPQIFQKLLIWPDWGLFSQEQKKAHCCHQKWHHPHTSPSPSCTSNYQVSFPKYEISRASQWRVCNNSFNMAKHHIIP